MMVGKVGRDVTVEQAYEHAKLVGLGLLAAAKAAAGELSKIEVLKVLGMVNAVPEFTDQPKVINGCSGFARCGARRAGRHARSAVGMGSLPLQITVEIEAVMRIHDQSTRFARRPADPTRAVRFEVGLMGPGALRAKRLSARWPGGGAATAAWPLGQEALFQIECLFGDLAARPVAHQQCPCLHSCRARRRWLSASVPHKFVRVKARSETGPAGRVAPSACADREDRWPA